jgi:3D (Asp-Asp-Asp) domain-containing protein
VEGLGNGSNDQATTITAVDVFDKDASPNSDMENIQTEETVDRGTETERTPEITAPDESMKPSEEFGKETWLVGTITITEENASEYGVLQGVYQIYGYNPFSARQTGKKKADGITSSGEMAVPGETCAMSEEVPYGTMVYIEGLGVYRVNDRGVGTCTVDIAAATDEECFKITRKARVWILTEEA